MQWMASASAPFHPSYLSNLGTRACVITQALVQQTGDTFSPFFPADMPVSKKAATLPLLIMKPPQKKLALKYVPKLWASILFLLLLAGAYCLFQGRKEGIFRLHITHPAFADYYQHISNFSITYLLYASIGYMWLMAGVSIRYVVLLGAGFVLANLVYELWLSVLNTRDLIDAYYGVAGVLVALLFLALVNATGLRLNEKED